MKRLVNKRFGSFIVASALIIACINISIDRNNESVISFDNVEALADGENPGYSCLFFGTLDCPPSPIKVRMIIE